jgi:hypothetical protein
MIRRILAVVLGIALAIAIVAAVEALGHVIYPVPADIDWKDAAQVESYLGTVPTGAFFFVLAAWWLGTFGGGILACLIAREKPSLYSTIIGGFILAATVFNLISIPHPFWFSVTAVIGIAVMSYLAGLVGSARLVR